VVTNNSLPAVTLKVKTKVKGRFQPVGDITFKIYLGDDATGPLIATVKTSSAGIAAANIPYSLKNQWGSDVTHNFYAAFAGNEIYSPASADLTVSKARITIDTGDDRKVIVTVSAFQKGTWVPVKDVDVKIGIKGLDADLSIADKPNYTTDSLGKVSADFTRDSMPGDKHKNIILVARVEDNDQFGSLVIEKPAPWGKHYIEANNFDKRTLFARRGRSPIWLVFMAYSIIAVVWGILILLIYNLFTIKKLGKIALKT
jgi:hypothetical protein